MVVTVAIDEGPRFAIGAVAVKDHPELVDRLRVRSGMTFSRTAVADDRATLETLVQDEGYAFALVLPLTHVDLDRATIDVTWEIDRGKRARFGLFDIYNAPTDLVRSELGLAEGEPFSMSRLMAGKQRLISRGLTGVTIATKRGRTPELVDVIVELPAPD